VEVISIMVARVFVTIFSWFSAISWQFFLIKEMIQSFCLCFNKKLLHQQTTIQHLLPTKVIIHIQVVTLDPFSHHSWASFFQTIQEGNAYILRRRSQVKNIAKVRCTDKRTQLEIVFERPYFD
jgi:hypothetical protein